MRHNKKLLLASLGIAYLFVMGWALQHTAHKIEQQDSRLQTCRAELAQRQAELEEIEARMVSLQIRTEEDTEPLYVVIAHYATDASELPEGGTVVLDADAAPSLIHAAEEKGCELLYFFDAQAVLPKNRVGTVLRQEDDTEIRRQSLNGILSRYAGDSTAGVISDETVNIPYIFIKTDDYALEERLQSLVSGTAALLVILHPDAREPENTLRDKIGRGELRSFTAAEAAERLRTRTDNIVLSSDEYQAEWNALKSRSADLHGEIERLYREIEEREVN